MAAARASSGYSVTTASRDRRWGSPSEPVATWHERCVTLPVHPAAVPIGLGLGVFLMTPWANAQVAKQAEDAVTAPYPASDDREAQLPDRAAVVAKEQHTLAHGSSVNPQAERKDPQVYESQWYGGWIFGLDGIAIVTTPILVGVGVYALGGPIVHLSKGEPGRAAASLGLRIGLPVALGGLVASQQQECSPTADLCGTGKGIAIAAAAGVGALAAMIIDSAALAYRKVPVKPQAVGIAYTPSIAVSHDSAVVSVSGTF